MTVNPSELRPGYQLGRYQLLMPLAKGGMGQVWAARLTGPRAFQKLVAIKTILAAEDDAEQLELMLFEEASLASCVHHPNVAQTLDLGEQHGALYLVMEWVNGEALDYILRVARPNGGLPLAVGVHLIEQACRGLHAAHQARDEQGRELKIVHRDVSPQNLLVTYSGNVKLIDFGVAKAMQQISAPTQIGQVKGKFAYMSPEQIQGDPLDARADIFAMGICLYRATTGMHPYRADNPAATVNNILLSTPALPSAVAPGYPKALEEVVMKALARDKADRYATAEEMAVALDQSLPPNVRAAGDHDTQAFLHKLFATRMDERSNMLRSALRAADRGGEMSDPKILLAGLPHSQSTMRAVLLESDEAEVIRFDPPVLALATPSAKQPPVRALRRAAVVALAVAAGLAVYLSSRPRIPQSWFAASAAQPRAQGYDVAPSPGGGPVPSIEQKSAPPAIERSAEINAAPPPAADALAAGAESRDRAQESAAASKLARPGTSARPTTPPPPLRAAVKKRDKSRVAPSLVDPFGQRD